MSKKKVFVGWRTFVSPLRNLGDATRCVHIGDRESDIYELFCECQSLGTHFLFRTCVDRRAEAGEMAVNNVMEKRRVKAVHRVEVMDDNGQASTAVLEIKYHRLVVCRPIGKQKRYDNLTLTVIHAVERGTPKDRAPVSWKLITDLTVKCKAVVIEKLEWYTLRWKIETFHNVLKSGCRAEDSKLRNAERLANLIAMMCIIAWRVLWMCQLNRVSPDLPASLVFTEPEMKLLEHLQPMKETKESRTVGDYVIR